MTRWLVWLIIILALIVLSTVFWFYWSHFKHLQISPNPGDWGPFGDYIGGTLNPILSFLTVVLLSSTIILQSRQLSISTNELELSRKELELTRAELKRTAEAQELSEKALRAQAEAANSTTKLATINALLEFYTNEIKTRGANTLPSNHPRNVELLEFSQRRRMLEAFLHQRYVDLIGSESEQ
jgi:hypothetical protein